MRRYGRPVSGHTGWGWHGAGRLSVMRLSTRDQLRGTVSGVQLGDE
jgi:hypothetical protein